MRDPFNIKQSIETISKSRLEAISRSIDSLNDAIRIDQQGFAGVSTPLELMQLRAEHAEAALKVSDIALAALKVLQANSFEIIKASDMAMDAMKAMIRSNDADAHHKELALTELKKVIEKNTNNLKASASALSAVTELAFNDALTGLPNRRLLQDRLKQSINNNRRWDTHSAAIFLDLDKFKILNDKFGHEVGDGMLIAVANRLKLAVRETDTVARFGGDEFVVLLDRLSSDLSEARAEAEIVAQKIISLLTPPYDLRIRGDSQSHRTIPYQNFASLGVVIFDGDESKENNILDWADEAMYWAKSEGGRTIRFYDAIDSTKQTLNRLYSLATENDIETANHGIRMQQYAYALANRALKMNLFPGELNSQLIEKIFKATQLHDIGKTKIPYSILYKKSKLTNEEWAVMKTHTSCGAEILEDAKIQNNSLSEFLDTAIDIAVSHHEYWDGNGYPRGLAGSAIPLAGRIIAIADVYDALISRRSYKEPWDHEDALAELTSKSGTQFDPLLIKALMREHLISNASLSPRRIERRFYIVSPFMIDLTSLTI